MQPNPIEIAYQQGYDRADEEWRAATGYASIEDARKASKTSGVEYPGVWEHADGGYFARGYPNGRFGYYETQEDGQRVFVDIEPPPGYWEKYGKK
jgi:hypothetical protein